MLSLTNPDLWPGKATRPSASLPAAERHASPRSLESQALFAGSQEVVIAHGDERYRLRITRQGKLILTK